MKFINEGLKKFSGHKALTLKLVAFVLSFTISTLCSAEKMIYPDYSSAIQKLATPFKDGDRVAFIGDSITYGGGSSWGKYHSDIFKYYVTRFPNSKMAYFNDGIGGNRVADVLKRFKWDVLEDKPNRATIMLGMNDIERWLHRSDEPAGYIKKQGEALNLYKTNLEKLLGMLKENGISVILIGPSIFDNTLLPLNWTNQPGANKSLIKCSVLLKEMAAKNGLEYLDFNAPMLLANSYLQSKDPNASVVGKDRVHPGTLGHLIMTYSFLKSQGVTSEVATVEIDVNNSKTPNGSNCEVSELSAKPDGVSFQYKPFSLPYPVSKSYMDMDHLVPFTEDLNKEIIKVTGLKEGIYKLEMNGVIVLQVLSEDLKDGINIALAANNPGQIQSQKVSKWIDERATTEIDYIRKLRMFELEISEHVNVSDPEAIKAFLDLENNRKKLSPLSQKNLKDYISKKSQEAASYEKIKELELKAYGQSKPTIHKVNLTYIDSKDKASSMTGIFRNKVVKLINLPLNTPSHTGNIEPPTPSKPAKSALKNKTP